MAGCLGIGGVSFGRCPQPTTSRQKQQVFQTFLKSKVLNKFPRYLCIEASIQ
jgi:hypothetical protein